MASKRVRVVEPNRSQGVIRFEMPETALPVTHPARVLWEVTGTLKLERFTQDAKAVEGRAGRPVISPRMKLCVWLYAISQGIGSAREIARLVSTDSAFGWITGGWTLSHHVLSAFRVEHPEALHHLMTDVLASLMHKGLLSLALVAQDGTRIRASASAPSFRSYGSLLECREQAALHVKAVLADADNPELTDGEKVSREAAARDFQSRVEAAIETVKVLQSEGRREPRASTTDVEARVMKMPDGGFRPGYNVQLAVAGSELGGPRTIVGVRVHNVGSDMSSITPMLADIRTRTGVLPTMLLADANHATHACIDAAAASGVELLMSVPDHEKRATSARRKPSPAVEAWRARMETPEAKYTFRARASLCELANAHVKDRFGLDHVLVRGTGKVTSVALLVGLAFNLLQHATSLLA
jgi:transposase